MLKAFFRSRFVVVILSRLTASYITLVYKTCRWHFIGRENIQPYWDQKKPLITCFWHGRLLLMPCAWMSENPFAMLISGHPDGRFIAQAIHYHGLKTVTGSSSKGGSTALRALLSQLKKGVSIGITPDGPRGPRFKASEGIVTISRLTGVDILPSTYSTSGGLTINSWDQFRLPLPFSKAVMIWSKPLPAPSRDSSPQELEELRHQVETTLNDICSQGDRLCGLMDQSHEEGSEKPRRQSQKREKDS